MPYSIEREVEDIEAMIDAAGGSAYLYGNSSGAVLALEAALRLPDKVNAVVVYDAPYANDQEKKQSYAALAQQIREHLDSGDNAAALKQFLSGIGIPGFLVSQLPLSPGWKTMKALAPTLMYDIELTKDLPPVERLANITTPIHVAYGSRSPAWMEDVARRIADAIPGATWERVDGQDHMAGAKALLPILKNAFAKTAVTLSYAPLTSPAL